MKVTGISCSPRDAATARAIRLALQRLQEKFDANTRFHSLRGKEIGGCIHCDYCLTKGNGCSITDDMGPIYDDLSWCEVLVLGTPVYNGTLSSQAKALIDRTRAMVATNKYAFKGKLGVALAVGGDRNGGQEIALHAIIDFFIINHISPVGGGAFGGNFGITFWSKDRGASGIDDDGEGMRSLRHVLREVGKRYRQKHEPKEQD